MNYRHSWWMSFVFVCAWLASPLPASAQEGDIIELVIGLLNDSDIDMRSLALEQVRTEVKGEAATLKFAEQLPELSAGAQAGLISALADRADVAAKPAVTEMLDSNDETVRIAAIRALSALGDASDCAQLISMLRGSSAEQTAAVTSLIQIQGEGVPDAITTEMANSAPSIQTDLIDILASRRAFEAIPKLLEVAVGDNGSTRMAAMRALGNLASAEHIPTMVRAVLKADRGSERSNAERNVVFVCNRVDDMEKRSEPLLAAINKLTPNEQTVMLTTLGRVGGDAALTHIENALASKDGATHSAGLVALANWPDASVAPQLTRLAYEDPHLGHQLTALRAVIRMAPLADGRSNYEKLALLQKAMGMSIRYVDRNYALQRASAIRIPETLRWVLPFVDDPHYSDQACKTIVELAHIRDLRDENKEEFHAALDKVMATSKDATVIDRANRYKKGQTWVRPK